MRLTLPAILTIFRSWLERVGPVCTMPANLSDFDVSTYDATFVPGGLAPMAYTPEHPLLKQVVKETYERGAVVGAVCHGPVLSA